MLGAFGGEIPVVSRDVVRAHLPSLIAPTAPTAPTAPGGFVPEKVEGLAIAADGTARVSTGHDDVGDHSVEMMFSSIGMLD